MGKGISSIISVVLVLAVTITVIGLFSGWAPNLIQDIQDSTENTTNREINCNDADLEIEAAKYFSSGSNTTAVVRNNGNIDLNDVRVEAWENDLPMNSTNTNISQGGLVSVNITTTSKPTSIRANSKRCTVNDRFEDISG